jgi:DNA polymerase III epsilon subunit-like protein
MKLISAENEWEFEWIETAEKLSEISELLAKEDVISIDTETVGWQSGNERLSLVQIGVPSKKHVYIIDPLAIEDISAMQKFISSPAPLLIAHNIQFEEKQFARHGIKLKGGVDTLSLARELRPDLPNHTLQTCCRLILGIEISKTEQVSDWSLRPLSAEQLKYARLDAELAYALYAVLAEMQAKLEIDLSLKVSDLMGLLSQTVEQRFELLEEISPELALLNARDKALRETIKLKLIQGEPPYEGEYGECKVSKVKKTEINPQKVRNIFPEFAALAITEHVERDRLKSLMKEYGVPEDKLDLVLDITGYTDRLNLTLK